MPNALRFQRDKLRIVQYLCSCVRVEAELIVDREVQPVSTPENILVTAFRWPRCNWPHNHIIPVVWWGASFVWVQVTAHDFSTGPTVSDKAPKCCIAGLAADEAQRIQIGEEIQ